MSIGDFIPEINPIISSFLDVPVSEMEVLDADSTETFIRMSFTERKLKDENSLDFEFNEEKANSAGEIGMILFQRLLLDETKISFPLALLICSICNGNPAQLVMWAYTLNRIYREIKKDRVVTIEDWSLKFPIGVPNNEAMRKIWEQQKVSPEELKGGNDNLLDRQWPWVSNYESPDENLSREEWLEKSKAKALDLLEIKEDDPKASLSLFFSELCKHKELKNHMAIELGIRMIMNDVLKDKNEIRSFIEDFDK
jgi:hypothetical protein